MDFDFRVKLKKLTGLWRNLQSGMLDSEIYLFQVWILLQDNKDLQVSISEQYSICNRFCHTNPGLFRNADTAYVLAYAVIMLNTDAHNPMVWPKMTKADFVKINSGQPGDQQEHAPKELLEDLYDCIVKDEIKLKSDSEKVVPKKKELEEKSRLVTVLNLGQPKKTVDPKVEGEKIVQSTQDLLKKGVMKRGVFHVAKTLEVARPMLDAIGWPLLATFSATMEERDDPLSVTLCMQGFRMGVHVTKVLRMDTMRSGFLTSLMRCCTTLV